MMYRWIGWAVTVIILLATTTFDICSCPCECHCSTWVVKCINKGLKTIPEGIPLTARQIDLSNNPSMHIPRDYFLKFKHLFILILNNCGQNAPVLLPNTLRIVSLNDNKLTVDAIRMILSNTTNDLRKFSLTHNNLQPSDVQQVLRLLPATLKNINLSGNEMHKLTNKDIGRFKKLTRFECSYCHLKSIEEHTFDNLNELQGLWLNHNDLGYLTKNIFTQLTKLRELSLYHNKLSEFNATNIGLKSILQLDLSHNQIASLDITTIQPRDIWLNDNRIERLGRQMVENSSFVTTIYLQNNKVHFISKNAFKNIKHIGTLLLQNNNIQSLPKGLFKGMSIKRILLQQNNLSSLNGVFDGLLPGLFTLDISRNKGLRNISGADFASLHKKSNIYLSCNNMRAITDLSQLNGTIQCFPKSNLIFSIDSLRELQCKGYECISKNAKSTYICTPCREGYYSDCSTTRSCTKCPPGSYYQDQPVSYKCKECRPGQFVPPEKSPGTDPLDCQTCPQGTNTTIIAGTRACNCLYGHSRQYRFGPCQKCNHNGFDCTSHDYQTLQNGYWITWNGTKPEYSSQNITIYNQNQNKTICQDMYDQFIINLDITDDTYDRTTMRFKCQMPLPIKCPMPGSCLGGINPTCSHRYNGALCAVCNRGYSLQFNQCVQCPQPLWASLQFIGYIALFFVLCFIISLTDKIIIQENDNCLRRKEQYHSRTFADIILSSLKILIGFYQIFISIIDAFSNIHWPQSLKTATNTLQYIQFQIIKLPSLRCIKPEWSINAVDEFWIMFIILISIPFLASLYYVIKSSYVHFQFLAPSIAKNKRYLCARNCIKVVALFLFVTYPLTSAKIIQILPISCHSFCTAKRHGNCVHSLSFLRSDYSIPCPTMADHKATLIAGYICLIIPFGLPVILFMLLRSYAPKQLRSTRHPITRVMEDNGDDENSDNLYYCPIVSRNDYDDNLFDDSNAPVMTSALKFSFENYHARCWYWEVIEMIRKLLMTIGIVLFLRHTKIGLTCTIIVAMIFTVLHAIIKPLKNEFESAAQFLSLVLVPLNLAYGSVLQSQDTQNASITSEEKDSYYEGIFLVIINSTLIIIVIVRIIIIIVKAIRSRCEK